MSNGGSPTVVQTAVSAVRAGVRGAAGGAAVSGGLMTLVSAYALVRGKAAKESEGSLVESALTFGAFTGTSAASYRLWEGLLSKLIISKPLRALLAGLASGWPIAVLPESAFRSYATLYMTAQALGALYSTAVNKKILPAWSYGTTFLCCIATAGIQYCYVYEPHLFNPSYYRVVHRLSSHKTVDRVVDHLRKIHAVVIQYPSLPMPTWIAQLEAKIAQEEADEGVSSLQNTSALEVVKKTYREFGSDLRHIDHPKKAADFQAAMTQLQTWERKRSVALQRRMLSEPFVSCRGVHGATSPVRHVIQWVEMCTALMRKSASLYLSVHCLPLLLTFWKRSPLATIKKLLTSSLPKALRSVLFVGTYGMLFCIGLCGGRAILKKDTKLQLILAGFLCGNGVLWEAASRRGEIVAYLLTQVWFMLWQKASAVEAADTKLFTVNEKATATKEGGLPSPMSTRGLLPTFSLALGLIMCTLELDPSTVKPMYRSIFNGLYNPK